MRKISLVLVAAMLLSAGSVFANDVNDSDPSKSLSAQIKEMLNDNHFSKDDLDTRAQVRFTVNNESEIVVLSVDTESARLESFVKGRLNYQKIKGANLEEGELFTVSVRIES